jgi:hypothetical protein
MSDIDHLLGRLREAPVPSQLAQLDGAVFEAIASGQVNADGLGMRPIGIAALAALAIGIFGAVPGTRDEAAAAASPFGDVSPLAPSTLLDSGR